MIYDHWDNHLSFSDFPIIIVSLDDFDFTKLSLEGLIRCIGGVLVNLLKSGSRITLTVHHKYSWLPHSSSQYGAVGQFGREWNRMQQLSR